MPVAVRAVRAGKEGTLDLYEQGVERRLIFRSSGEMIEVECSSYTRWQPRPSSIRMAKEDLLKQLSALLEEFAISSK
jgi:hypothetical protein